MKECNTLNVHAAEQARFQIAALAATLIISIGGGIITGLIIKLPIFVYQGGKKVNHRVLCYSAMLFLLKFLRSQCVRPPRRTAP